MGQVSSTQNCDGVVQVGHCDPSVEPEHPDVLFAQSALSKVSLIERKDGMANV